MKLPLFFNYLFLLKSETYISITAQLKILPSSRIALNDVLMMYCLHQKLDVLTSVLLFDVIMFARFTFQSNNF